ncbi:isocitrate lyase/PEP mutase family protein [Phytohabitans aurantiacus]|jgi:2-methylisocitrate lyase-like PEP mutase family enzyme|uniref:Carboxyvinyl-carboxyphosphonate phosphorylmutase n=1 Tax=Phytohabitans aurantiacus TaxID=3016789 RepID=A0ABQ5R921_9ACTN|nr:isocitrate lyase/phosphoenolpyruvate mutase family protein [Phytohabitans aurantiacus]GLI02382.1 carboxyvinyl-carboxyphosphonate phosphorylmutase [Phytohabitans aurantiacus]
MRSATGASARDPGPALAARAAALRALHRPGDPLVLANAWDAASARATQAAGFAAVATSSAAVAEVLGYADGETTPAGEMLDAVARIVRAVEVPVTADLERGYRMRPAELVERLAATGAVGCNLEDSDPGTGKMVDPGEQADFLAAVRAAAVEAGFDLVVNARIDVYMPEVAGVLDEAVARAERYLAAGADCVYPIGATDADVPALVEAVGGRVNVLARAGGPRIADLAAQGVARVSHGSGLFRATAAHHEAQLAMIRASLTSS